MNNEKRVIIIEDDRKWLKRYVRDLSKHPNKYHCFTYDDFDKAFEDLKIEDFDVVVTDLALWPNDQESEPIFDDLTKGMGIVELAWNKNIPIIIVSGHANEELVREAFKKYKISDIIFKKKYTKSALNSAIEVALLESASRSGKKIRVDTTNDRITFSEDYTVITKVPIEPSYKKEIVETNIQDVIENLPILIKSKVKTYIDENKEELKKNLNYLAKTEYQGDLVLNTILSLFQKIKKDSKIIDDYLYSINKNTKISYKLEIALAIVSGILDAKSFKNVLDYRKYKYGKIPLEIFDIYTDLAKVYFSLKEKAGND